MEISIREATESDFDHVSPVFLDELAFHSDLLPDRFQMVEETMTRKWFLDIVQNQDKGLLLAQLGSNIVGVLHIEMHKSPGLPFFVPRSYAYVSDLAVSRTFRFRGYGRNLMKYAIAWAKDRGADAIELKVWAINKDAISFYERLGFETVQRRMSLGLDAEL
ncbi:MAG: GNAT family N-acetyltransferase [Candidatus Promineifilaceae bacterium]